MKISIIAWGGNGDVLPMLSLAKGLRRAGHSAAVAAPARCRKAVEEYGCRYVPIGPDPDRVLDASDLQSSLSSTSGIGALRSIGRLSYDMAREGIAGGLPAVKIIETFERG